MSRSSLTKGSYKEDYVDPIYGLVRIDEPFSRQLKLPQLQKEKRRLEGIKSLGIISRFFPAGSHTKWEHYLGMFFVAGQIEKGLGKEDAELLKWLCLLGGVGHLPCTFVTASALVQASFISVDFRKHLKSILSAGLGRVCDECNECEEDPINAVLKLGNLHILRGLLSAYRLKQHILAHLHLTDKHKLIKACVCPESELHRIYAAISRYDYMQRDLYHTGVARFSIGANQFFAPLAKGVDAFEQSPNMRLLNELSSYLTETLYLDPRVATLESLLAKVVAQQLYDGSLAVESLMEYDDGQFFAECGALGQNLASAENVDVGLTLRREFTVSDVRDKGSIHLEKSLLGPISDPTYLLSYPDQNRLAVSVHSVESAPTIGRVYHVVLSNFRDSRKLLPILRSGYRMVDTYLGTADSLRCLAHEFLPFLFGIGRIQDNLDQTKSTIMESLITSPRAVEPIVNAWLALLSPLLSLEERDPAIRHFRRLLETFERNRGKLNANVRATMAIRRAVKSLPLLPPNAKIMRELWQPVAKNLATLASGNNGQTASLLEAYAFLRILQRRRPGEKKVAVLPGTKLFVDEASAEWDNEVDVLELSFSREEVILRLFECTTSHSQGKAGRDHTKLQQIQSRIAIQRWEDVVVLAHMVERPNANRTYLSVEDL